MFYFEGTPEVMCCYFAQRDGRGWSGTGTVVEDRDCSEVQLWVHRLTLRETDLRQPTFHFKQKPAVYQD